MVYLNLQIQQIAQGLIAAGYSLGDLPAEALVAVSATAPSSPGAGQLWLNSTTNALSIYNGVTWDALGLTSVEKATLATLNGNVYTKAEVDNAVAVVANSVTLKQDALVSGSTIKTINGTNILGSGNVLITTPMGYLNDLQDSTITAPISGQVLSYSGTEWVNTTPVAGITSHTQLSSIGTNTHAQIDVQLASLAVHNHTGVYEPANSSLAKLNVAQTFSSPQRGAINTITYGTTITPDFGVANNFSCTLTGNVIVANPTNIVPGQYGKITLIQDATGGRTAAYGTYYKFAGRVAPTMVTTANAKTTYYYEVDSPTEIVLSAVSDWS